TIKANSGLTEDEIQKMVRDAEANAEEDKRARELAESRNQGDALVHSTRKSMADYGDKLEAGEREKVEAAIRDLEEALKGNDKAAIDGRTSALATAAQKLGEAMVAAAQGQASQGGTESPQSARSGEESGPPRDDDVVDADFKEVKK
ncbi:MAG: Hsp70 family protein, partial [Noviherbaspirillum sp.]